MTKDEAEEFLEELDNAIETLETALGDYKPNQEVEKMLKRAIDIINDAQGIIQE